MSSIILVAKVDFEKFFKVGQSQSRSVHCPFNYSILFFAWLIKYRLLQIVLNWLLLLSFTHVCDSPWLVSQYTGFVDDDSNFIPLIHDIVVDSNSSEHTYYAELNEGAEVAKEEKTEMSVIFEY